MVGHLLQQEERLPSHPRRYVQNGASGLAHLARAVPILFSLQNAGSVHTAFHSHVELSSRFLQAQQRRWPRRAACAMLAAAKENLEANTRVRMLTIRQKEIE